LFLQNTLPPVEKIIPPHPQDGEMIIAPHDMTTAMIHHDTEIETVEVIEEIEIETVKNDTMKIPRLIIEVRIVTVDEIILLLPGENILPVEEITALPVEGNILQVGAIILPVVEVEVQVEL
jgi:hypothetical protein